MKSLLYLLFLCLAPAAYGQSVVIKGLDKSHKRTAVFVTMMAPYFDPDYKMPTSFESVYVNDSVFTITVTGLEKPTFANYVSHGAGWDCLLIPGDRVTMVLPLDRKRTPSFSGKNAANYSYWVDQDKIVRKTEVHSKLRSAPNWAAYKAVLNRYRASSDSLISVYRNSGASPFLLDAATSERQGEYFMLLAGSLRASGNWADPYLPSPLVSSDTLDFRLLGQEQLMSSQLYAVGLLNLAQIADGNRHDRSTANFNGSVAYIQRHFSGRIKDFLLGKLVQKYTKVSGNLPEGEFVPVLEEAIARIEDPAFRGWAMSNREYYRKANRAFPEEVLQSRLLTGDSTLTTFAEVLNKYRGKPVVIDFWATWCGPCKVQFRDGKENVEELKKQGYQFLLYISIDEVRDFDKMKADAGKYNLTGHNYLLRDGHSAMLFAYLNLAAGIPRYILVDKDGVVKYLNMPGPSDKNGFRNLLLMYQ